jgi:hypothetical protein
MVVRLSALRTGRTLLPTNIIIFMFLVLISSSTIIDRSTLYRFMVSLTSWPLYPLRKNPRYPLGGRLVWLQIRSGGLGEEKNLFLLSGIEPRFSP